MNNGQLQIPPVAVRLLIVLAAIQLIHYVLPENLDAYLIYFLAFDMFRDGAFDPVWLYGAFTSVFVHADWWHLLANATWLVVLSAQLAAHLTPKRFVALFVLTGAAGAVTHGIVNWGESQFLVGASGAVFGFLGAGAYVLIRGRDGFSKPTWKDFAQYILIMMIMNVGYALLSGGMISWEAHAGGFFAGLVLFPFLRSPPGGARHLRAVED